MAPHMRTISCFCLLFPLIVASAAEGGASIKPAPGFEPPQAGGQPPAQRPMTMPPMQMARPSMAYEVDALVIAPGDPAGLAAWAELAAQGFHVVSAIAQDDKQVLFFERMKAPGGTDIRLPTAITADAGLAARVQAKLQQILAERQQVQARPPQARPPQATKPEGK